MPESSNILLSWKVPEHTRHQRGRLWYFLAFVVSGFCIVYGVLTNNFLFALIVILFAIIYTLLHMQEVPLVDFSITHGGIALGSALINYSDIQSFWLILRPEEKVRCLYFRTNSFLNPLLSIELEDQSPEKIREILAKYLKEDTTIKDESTLEILSRRFKL